MGLIWRIESSQASSFKMQEWKKSIKVGNLQQLCSDPITDLHRSQGHVLRLAELEGGEKKQEIDGGIMYSLPCRWVTADFFKHLRGWHRDLLLQEVPVRTSAGGSSAVAKIQGARGLMAERFDLLVLWLQHFRERKFNPCFNKSFIQSSSEFISIRLVTYAGGVQPRVLVWGWRETFNNLVETPQGFSEIAGKLIKLRIWLTSAPWGDKRDCQQLSVESQHRRRRSITTQKGR